ncbi:Protein SDA1-like protein, partial [Diplonema papillatum]
MSRAGIMDTKQPFKGTLLQLQDKVKRDPAGYKDDVLLQLRHFESKIKLFELSPSTGNKDLCDLVGFLGHVAPLYKSESTGFPVALLDLLDKHRDVLDREVRRSMVQALCLLRSKNYVEPKDVLPLYFRLFKVQDRELRKILLAHIVGDVKRINSKIKNPATNKLLQNYMHQVVGEDDPIAGRHALWVIIDLYRRKIWTDDRIVNVISKACFSKHTKIMTTALRFLMGQYPKDMEDDAEDSEDELEAPSKNKRNYAKKTKGRETAKKKAKTQYERQQRKKDSQVNSVFLPIEVLNDPQGFAERLFSQLQRTKERFNVRMLHVAVLSAMIHAHKLMIFNFYPFLQRYMEPHQQNVTHIMAYASQAVHDLVPPENLHSLMMSIANHFVTDRASPDAITVGINTLREICRRQPLVMTEDLLRDIAQYKRFKRDKGVVMASRSMIQLFRELQPSLLARKDRGRDADLEKEVTGFGASLNKKSEFEGIELLEEYYEKKRLKDEARSSTGVGADDDEWSAEETDESSASGSWISVSQSDSEADQSDAEASDDDDEGGKRPKADKKQVKPAAKPAKPDGELSDDEEWEECSLDEEMEEDEDAEGGDDEEWEECSEGDSADFEEPTPKE